MREVWHPSDELCSMCPDLSKPLAGAVAAVIERRMIAPPASVGIERGREELCFSCNSAALDCFFELYVSCLITSHAGFEFGGHSDKRILPVSAILDRGDEAVDVLREDMVEGADAEGVDAGDFSWIDDEALFLEEIVEPLEVVVR